MAMSSPQPRPWSVQAHVQSVTSPHPSSGLPSFEIKQFDSIAGIEIDVADLWFNHTTALACYRAQDTLRINIETD
jgi:hypothetical protein